ncbi:Hypothetical protein I595_1702 [Croceitalea dokdonensis DOKDO 023]|uniref:Natural resistance-associated macrophage protein n=1 Tax=Croceitalea dokdonensis DOKDO 023 TaxID=1300341 RepID=A0A0P7AVV5_9FLAO|nr:divalent metal cation transporter [Croceitalea dokdonensis]KPM32053.1 Hypothetical protein I595_1702 [Croceitalea dokdonensis DOKDO 023]
MEKNTQKSDSLGNHPYDFPLAAKIPQEVLDKEVEKLEGLKTAPLHKKLLGYAKMGGPGFMGAAITLGAGTLTASMLSGAEFGYKTLWIYWVAMGLSLFMMAAMARFTSFGKEPFIRTQNRYHGRIIGSFLTAFIGLGAVAVIFNSGQYSLGTNILESMTPLIGFEFPRQYNWVVYMGITTWLTLSYGKGSKGTRLVENFMKICIGIMILCFGATLILVGIDWNQFFKGVFVPWLPSGSAGIDLFIASSAAAVGVADWMFFHYSGLARGWGKKHESLQRSDFSMGLFIPFVLINFLVVAVFAQTLYGEGTIPQTAAELSKALEPLLGADAAMLVFYIGFLSVPISSSVGLGILSGLAFHEAFGWKMDTSSWRWKLTVLLPQFGFLAVWYPNPVWLVIIIGAFLSLTNNVVGWSVYLLLNDKRALGDKRSSSRFWNTGVLIQITLLNMVAILYVLNRLGLWI